MIKSGDSVKSHWKALGLILVAVLAFVSGVYAYWNVSNPTRFSPVSSSSTSYPLELRMELNKTEFQQGELIEVKVIIKNISNRTVKLTAWNGWYDFNITDTNSMVVYEWTQDRGWASPVYKTLNPIEAFDRTQQSTVYDGTINPPIGDMVPVRLPKGTYQIVEFTPPLIVEYLEPYERIGECALTAPPVMITIS